MLDKSKMEQMGTNQYSADPITSFNNTSRGAKECRLQYYTLNSQYQKFCLPPYNLQTKLNTVFSISKFLDFLIGCVGSIQWRRWGRQFAALQGLPGGLYRYARLTGHTHLAQQTTVALELEGLFDILSGACQVLPALLFVVAGRGHRTDRATINIFAAGPIIEKEAIGSVVRIRPGRRLNGYLGHYRSKPHGFVKSIYIGTRFHCLSPLCVCGPP
jgi:hypothetical protein